MTKKKAKILAIIFSIFIICTTTILMWIKPYGGDVSLFHAISPFICGLWLADLIDKFYQRLIKKCK